jgi:hypothetical protein
MGETIHTYPVGDLFEHNTESDFCPCTPRVENNGSTKHIIHNSFDGREDFEDITEIQ